MALTNILSLLLVIMTFASYIPQYYRLLALGSSPGISITSLILITLLGQVQIVTMYYLFKSASLMRYGVPINTPPSTRDWLNLAQIVIQWVCSLLLLVLAIYLPTSTTSPVPAVLSKSVAVITLLFHISLFMFSTTVTGHQPDGIFGVFNIIRNINAGIVNPVSTFITCIAFLLQAYSMPPKGEPSAWSTWALGLQSFTFLLPAISWPFRLILPPNMWELGSKPVLLMEWYPWVGWACVNSAILAIGYASILFLSWSVAVNGKLGSIDERQSLLSPYER